jgi:RNA recognition motif-containing protein
MNSYSSGRRQRRPRGGGGRRANQERFRGPQEPIKTQKKTFWQRVAEFFGNGGDKTKAPPQPRNGTQPSSRPARKPERVEVTSPRLYVGNLSFDATESDLFELFNGVGHVQNAEVVSYRHNQRSKGFAFVQMQTVDEAKRAVDELHDKEFLGRRLVVSGAKSDQHQPR